jgi:glutathione S-transferase
MRLYYSPGACSLSPHIVLREAGLPFDLVKVDLKSRKTSEGDDFDQINPKGYVPLLELDDGRRLTEGPAIVQYIADQVATSHELVPPADTFARYQVQAWLNFITAELHKQFSTLFKPAPKETTDRARATIERRLVYVAEQLGDRSFLMGGTFSIADAYMFVMLRWARQMDIARPDQLDAYAERIAQRPAVVAALAAEQVAKNRDKGKDRAA